MFDIRNLATPRQIYKAHVAAVMSCDWSPTGTEFVSGGWDRTVRIWKEGQGTGPEVYHTKRMQRCVAVLLVLVQPVLTWIYGGRVSSSIFTADARFVLTGSDDGNVRLWKARAAEKLGVVGTREKAAMEYRDSLKERWKMDAEVGRIARYVLFSLPHIASPYPSRRHDQLSPPLWTSRLSPSYSSTTRCHSPMATY